MSQASEYAGAREQAQRLYPRVWHKQATYAEVDELGRLVLSSDDALTPDNGLDLASYIFEVMGDPPYPGDDTTDEGLPAWQYLAGQSERWRVKGTDMSNDEVPF